MRSIASRPVRLLVLALVVLMLSSAAVVGLAVPAAGAAQGDLVYFGDGEPRVEVGANSMIFASGYVRAVEVCPPGGVNDFMYAAADIYVVKHGSATFGSHLSNADGTSPATVLTAGGAFVDEPLAVTGPQGTLGEGTYDVVVDNCQTGYFVDGLDSVFADAVTVRFPPVLPPYSAWIGDMKEQATRASAMWVASSLLMNALNSGFSTGDAQTLEQEVISDPSKAMKKIDKLLTYVNRLKWASGGPGNVVGSALNAVANQAKHDLEIAQDPPDENFKQPTVIDPIAAVPVAASFAPQAAAEALGTPLATQGALSQALLHALERYQGATYTADPAWTLVHARELANLARALAAASQRSESATAALSVALAGMPGYDREMAALWDFAAEVRDHSWGPDERRGLMNLGLDPAEMTSVADSLIGTQQERLSYTVSIAAMQDELGQIAAIERDSISSLQALAGRMDAVVAGLAAQPSVPTTAPTADAGGPYTAVAGQAVTLRGQASTAGTGQSIASWAWDLDGDGAFDDATGASPTAMFGPNSPGLVGVRVTGSDGQVAVAYTVVTVDAGPRPVLSNITPAKGVADATVGVPLTFSAALPSGSGTWTLDSQPAGSGFAFTYTAKPADVGAHRLRLQVTAPDGQLAATDWLIRVLAVDADQDGWTATADCNDTDPLVNPGRTEVVGNGVDDDCNPATSDTPLDAVPGVAVSWGSGPDATATSLGRPVDANTPAGVPADIAGPDHVTQVAAGDRMGLALTSTGAVWAWGNGNRGQLGTGSTTDSNTATAVLGLSGTGQLGATGPKVTAVVSNGQSAALLADGTVAAWGDNTGHALGTDNPAAAANIPALIREDNATLTGITQVAAGSDFLALADTDGKLHVTGGVCGTSAGGTAAPVTGLPAPVARIAAGAGQLLIALRDGSLFGCGANGSGQLGRTAGPPVGAPIRIALPDRAGPPARLAAGDGTSEVLDTNGILWTFGANESGQLGTGTIGPDQANPAAVVLPAGPAITQLTDGADRMAVVRADGTLLTWGNGIPTPTAADLPAGMLINQAALGTTGNLTYTVATRSDPTLAWGSGAFGPALAGQIVRQPTLTDLPAFTDIAASALANAGITPDGRVWSWGSGGCCDSFMLGSGEGAPSRTAPGPVLGLSGQPGTQLRARAFAASTDSYSYNFAALLDGGQVAVWGAGGGGGWQGNGTADGGRAYYPVLVLDPDGSTPLTHVTQLAFDTNGGGNLALREDGTVVGWGGGYDLCQGDLPPVPMLIPIPITKLGSDNRQVMTNHFVSVVLKQDGSVVSCGEQTVLGRTLVGGEIPTDPGQVAGLGPGSVVQIAPANSGVLALKTDGTVWAWGRDLDCNLGCTSDASDQGTWRTLPQQIMLPPGPPVVSVQSNEVASFAIRADGSVLGWGFNFEGQAGLPAEGTVVAQPTLLTTPGDRPVWKITGLISGAGMAASALALVGDPVAHLADVRGVGIGASVGDASVSEGGAAKVTVSLTSPAGIDLPLHYATADGTAMAGTDYAATSGTVTIPAGDNSASITVPTIGNDVTEPDRTLTVTLSDPPGWATINRPAATVTIRDDDPAPTVSIHPPASPIVEGDTGTRDATFTLTLDHPSAATTAIGWNTTDGTAHAPDDYLPGQGSVTFTPGQTSATITVGINGDVELEPDESFGVALSDPQQLTLGTAHADATIADDEPVAVTISDATVASPTGGPVDVPFTITAVQVLPGETITAPWQVLPGGDTGVSGSGTVTLTHETPTATVHVTVNPAYRPGTAQYRVGVTDASASADRNVLARPGTGAITAQPGTPIATISGPSSVPEGSTAQLDASASSGTAPLGYAWTIDNAAAGTNPTLTVGFPAPGQHTIGLTVTDSAGQTATTTHPVTATNVAPTVHAIADQHLTVGDTLAVTSSFTDPGANHWTATVDYGDGPQPLILDGKQFALTHTFPTAEVRAVTVRVCDDAGGCGQTVFTVTVTQPDPVITSVDPAGGPSAGGTQVTVTGHDFLPATTPTPARIAAQIADPAASQQPPTITFDGIPGTEVTCASTEHCTVTTPPHNPGTVDVQLTTTDGRTSSPAPAAQYHYVAPAPPTKTVPPTTTTQPTNTTRPTPPTSSASAPTSTTHSTTTTRPATTTLTTPPPSQTPPPSTTPSAQPPTGSAVRPSPDKPGSLSDTGFSTLPPLGIGLIAIALGLTLTTVRKRRRDAEQTTRH